ncbi:MAG: DUF4255 domain-containing protein [Acidimicrobiia bacterium]
MIHDVDESLRALAERDIINGAGAEVAFDAPTRDWATRRNTPTLNFYLYEIREDLERRSGQYEERRDDEGLVAERRLPPRRFKLSYLVTAWTQRPEDEHRLLSSVISCFIRFDALPTEVLRGELAAQGYPVRVTVGLPLPAERSISDVWSALGGELKPSLDLIVTAPFQSGRERPFGPPVLEEPRLGVSALGTEAVEHVVRRRRRAAGVAARPEDGGEPEEEVRGGRTESGRRLRVKTINR